MLSSYERRLYKWIEENLSFNRRKKIPRILTTGNLRTLFIERIIARKRDVKVLQSHSTSLCYDIFIRLDGLNITEDTSR